MLHRDSERKYFRILYFIHTIAGILMSFETNRVFVTIRVRASFLARIRCMGPQWLEVCKKTDRPFRRNGIRAPKGKWGTSNDVRR